MEIQQVALDSERCLAEGGTRADVGDGIESLFANARSRYIDAVRGNKLVVLSQVDSGDGVLVPVAAPAFHSGHDVEHTSKKVARTAHLPGAQQAAHLAAGYGTAAQHHYRIRLHREPELAAQLRELRRGAAGLVAKVEVLAFMNLDGAKLACQYIAGKFGRSGAGKLQREGNDHQGVQTSLRQQGFFAAGRRDQARRCLRPQNLQRMRLEGYGHSAGVGFAGAAHHFLQNLPMTAMNAVEIPHGHDAGTKIGGDFLQCPEDPHAISNSSLSPSWARRTCSGNDRLVSSWGRSWQMWVKNARRGCNSSTRRRELATVECVGCGRCRSASRNRTCSPRSRSMESEGISLKSVR